MLVSGRVYGSVASHAGIAGTDFTGGEFFVKNMKTGEACKNDISPSLKLRDIAPEN